MRKLMLCGAAAAFFCFCSAAQDAPEILKKSAAALRSLTSYDITMTEIQDWRSPSDTSHRERRERWALSGKKSREEQPGAPITISDGEFTWQYYPGRSEYTKRPYMRRSTPPVWLYFAARNARVAGEESVPAGGRQVPCWVVEVGSQPAASAANGSHAGPTIVWIDKATYLPLKRTVAFATNLPGQESMASSITLAITTETLDQPPPDSLFQPDLPTGAVEVDQLSVPGSFPRSPLIGRSLPAINGTDLRGNPVSSAAWKDKFVVLHIGDIYNEVLPFCELLYRAFNDRNVAVVNLVTGHPADATGQLARLGYTFPSMMALDTMTSVAMGFTTGSLEGIIIADKTGKVVYHSNGLIINASMPAVLKALREAGVW